MFYNAINASRVEGFRIQTNGHLFYNYQKAAPGRMTIQQFIDCRIPPCYEVRVLDPNGNEVRRNTRLHTLRRMYKE